MSHHLRKINIYTASSTKLALYTTLQTWSSFKTYQETSIAIPLMKRYKNMTAAKKSYMFLEFSTPSVKLRDFEVVFSAENRYRQSVLSLFINKRLPVAAMLFLGHGVPSLCGCMRFQYGRTINTARMIRKRWVAQTLTFTLTLNGNSSMVFSQQSKPLSLSLRRIPL